MGEAVELTCSTDKSEIAMHGYTPRRESLGVRPFEPFCLKVVWLDRLA